MGRASEKPAMMCRALRLVLAISSRLMRSVRGSVTKHRLHGSWLGKPLDNSGNEAADFRCCGRRGEQKSENQAHDGLPDTQAHIAVSDVNDCGDDEHERNGDGHDGMSFR